MRSLWDVPFFRQKRLTTAYCSTNPVTGHQWEEFGTTKPTTIMGPIDPATGLGNMQTVDVNHVVLVLCTDCGQTPAEVLAKT